MNPLHIKHLKPEIAYRILLIEGEEFTLANFLEVNCCDNDVTPPADEEIDRVLELEHGESCFCGIVEITRVK